MNIVKSLLQELLNDKSSTTSELVNLFDEKYPDELGISDLLRDYVYSEHPLDETVLINILKELLKGKV